MNLLNSLNKDLNWFSGPRLRRTIHSNWCKS